MKTILFCLIALGYAMSRFHPTPAPACETDAECAAVCVSQGVDPEICSDPFLR